MLLRNLKKKTHKVHMNIGQNKYFKNMFMKDFVFEKQKKNSFQRTSKNKVQF
jgi:hypothetical protein